MPSRAVVRNAAFCLAHVPDLVRYGSKPRRELAAHAEEAERVSRGLRS